MCARCRPSTSNVRATPQGFRPIRYGWKYDQHAGCEPVVREFSEKHGPDFDQVTYVTVTDGLELHVFEKQASA